jgi:hypothetical protein
LNIADGPRLEDWLASGAYGFGLVLVALAQANTC